MSHDYHENCDSIHRSSRSQNDSELAVNKRQHRKERQNTGVKSDWEILRIFSKMKVLTLPVLSLLSCLHEVCINTKHQDDDNGGGAETQSDFIFSSQILNWLPITLMELHGVPFILSLQSKETKYTQAKFKFSTLWRIEIFCENWNSWASSKHVATRPWPDKVLLLIHGSWNLSSKNHLGVRRWGNWGGGEPRRQLAGITHIL